MLYLSIPYGFSISERRTGERVPVHIVDVDRGSVLSPNFGDHQPRDARTIPVRTRIRRTNPHGKRARE